MTPSWEDYYARVITQPHRPLTAQAVALMSLPARVAIDCGCGTGRDTRYLLEQGFQVHAFDKEAKALDICRQRFADNPKAQLYKEQFEQFCYPQASLIVANASLFFCDPAYFDMVWERITDALLPGGLFCGDLLGINDSWVKSPHHQVTAFTRTHLDALFQNFDILDCTERNEEGETAMGKTKHWHTYTVIARKLG